MSYSAVGCGFNVNESTIYINKVSFFFSFRRRDSFLFNFYWNTVDLQCCVSFRCTAKWISYTYTYIHSFLDSFPIEAITEYWVEFPVLYSSSLLVTYFIYSSMYMSIPIFQFIPLPNKVSLNRNTQNNNMFWSVDENVKRGLQEPNHVFPLGAIIQYLLIQCLQWLYRTKLPWVMRINCNVIKDIPVHIYLSLNLTIPWGQIPRKKLLGQINNSTVLIEILLSTIYSRDKTSVMYGLLAAG